MRNSCIDTMLGLRERLQLAQDICHGMSFLHSMESSLPRLELNPFHIFVSHKILHVVEPYTLVSEYVIF